MPARIRVEQPRVVEQLRRQRPRPRVDDRDDLEPLAHVVGVDARHEPQPVVDEPRQDRLRGDVDDVRPRLAQQDEHEAEEPLLVRGQHRREVVRDLEAERVDDDDRPLLGLERAHGQLRREVAQPRLQVLEGQLGHGASMAPPRRERSDVAQELSRRRSRRRHRHRSRRRRHRRAVCGVFMTAFVPTGHRGGTRARRARLVVPAEKLSDSIPDVLEHAAQYRPRNVRTPAKSSVRTGTMRTSLAEFGASIISPRPRYIVTWWTNEVP